jgi:hypothetical protein
LIVKDMAAYMGKETRINVWTQNMTGGGHFKKHEEG